MPRSELPPLIPTKKPFQQLFQDLRAYVAARRSVPEPLRGNMRTSAALRDRHRELAKAAGMTTPQFHAFLIALYESALEEPQASSSTMRLSRTAIAS